MCLQKPLRAMSHLLCCCSRCRAMVCTDTVVTKCDGLGAQMLRRWDFHMFLHRNSALLGWQHRISNSLILKISDSPFFGQKFLKLQSTQNCSLWICVTWLCPCPGGSPLPSAPHVGGSPAGWTMHPSWCLCWVWCPSPSLGCCHWSLTSPHLHHQSLPPTLLLPWTLG